MRERPILFSAPMVRALLAGTKTVTRRISTWKAREDGINLAFSGLEAGLYHSNRHDLGWVLRSRDGGGCWNDRTRPLRSPYGIAGDRLWVRESFTHITGNGIRLHYRADGEPTGHDGKVLPTEAGLRRWAPSIHMPRKWSRILLEVVSVRVERLHAITEEDARAEGVDISEPWEMLVNGEPGKVQFFNHRDAFAHLWEAINGERAGWKSNPWVWRVEFKRVADEKAQAA